MKYIIYMLALTMLFVSCDDRLEDLNTDKKNPGSVDYEYLFVYGTKELFDNMTSMSVNDNPFRMYAQMWAQTTYPDESQYTLTTREIPYYYYVNQYRDVLVNLVDAKTAIEEEFASGTSLTSSATLSNRIAIIDIECAYTFSTLVDVFGNVPYDEALSSEEYSFPSYDDASSIYSALDAELVSAVSILSNEEGIGFDSDIIYGGDLSKWIKFANTLRLRMALRIADADPSNSVSRANAAIAAGVFESYDDSFIMEYEDASPNTSPVHEDLVLSGRSDFVAANTIVDIMNDLDDPRRYVYFRENLGDDVFDGGIYGDANTYSQSTQIGDVLHEPTTAGVLLGYPEVEFMMAEMIERGGYDVTGVAVDHVAAGIAASFSEWGVDGADSYIASVGYVGGTTWKQELGIQKWLALYNQGLEAWTTWRILDFDGFSAPPGMEMDDIPLRFTYPLRENTLNGDAVSSAAAAIGGDETSTPIFWDVN